MMAGIYIHIPFCTKKCPYCDFVSFCGTVQTQKAYVDALTKEIHSFKDKFSDLCFDTIFIGGGTPSTLYQGGLTKIFNQLNQDFNLKIDEFSIESNPETTTKSFLDECQSIGVNRISLGLQTASNHLLKNLRNHTFEHFLQAIELIKQSKISNINADLMLGLPNQTKQDIQHSINQLIRLNLQHISVYGLKIEQNTPFFKQGIKTDDDKQASFYQLATKLLQKNNYIHYEISNFALKNYQCKHNLGYWQAKPYLGLGLNASSYYLNTRTTNTNNLNQYLNQNFLAFTENIEEKKDFEAIMLGLRTCYGVDLTKLKSFKLNQKAHQLIKANILSLKNNILTLNPTHYYLLNSVLSLIL